MRVVAGRWKGRVLKSPTGDAVRPTTDRVKEALFSILGTEVPGSVFVDLCCGAGTLGLEALSRGAEWAVFVDQARTSLNLARANLQLVDADPANFQLVCAEAVEWLQRWQPPSRPFIIVSDPPYGANLSEPLLQEMSRLRQEPHFRAGVLEEASSVVGDSVDRERILADCQARIRRYGQSRLIVLKSATD